MHRTFDDNLSFSRGARETTDLATLKAWIPGCRDVIKTGEDLDRQHIDYVAQLRRDAVLHIDGKTRRPGASRFWKKYTQGRADVPTGEPDLAIELWSVKRPDGNGVTGWTFDESSDTDLILYTFDPADTTECVLLSFQLLRMAARANYWAWMRRFGPKEQQTKDRGGAVRWTSECLLVPACVVQDAIRAVERGRRCACGVPVAPAPESRLRIPTVDEIFK